MTVVVFLRGMNLGKRRITNEALLAVVERSGFDDPSAYQASGNIILPCADDVEPAHLGQTLHEELGYEVDVFTRTGQELAGLVAAAPFDGEQREGGGKPQVIFLHGPTDADLSTVFPAGDRYKVIGSEIHWLPQGGLSESTLSIRALDSAVGGTTTRTLGTVQRITARISHLQ
jgi:uncharacterized protein (DUF1697 family)